MLPFGMQTTTADTVLVKTLSLPVRNLSGYIVDNTDCDDADNDIYPEHPNYGGEDNDCDGQTDESDVVDQGTWYTDSDSDGYGDTASAITSCTQPTNSTIRRCDDTDSTINLMQMSYVMEAITTGDEAPMKQMLSIKVLVRRQTVMTMETLVP